MLILAAGARLRDGEHYRAVAAGEGRIGWAVVYHADYVLAVGTATVILNVWGGGYVGCLAAAGTASGLDVLWLGHGREAMEVLAGTSRTVALVWIVFTLVVLLILLTDIPGTPPVVLPPAPAEVLPGKTVDSDPERFVWRGFRIDSVVAALAPVAGSSPSIYYAENLILSEAGQYSWKTLVVPILFYGLVLAVLCGASVGFYEFDLFSVIPPVAGAPVVLYVGIYVIAKSFDPPPPQGEPDQAAGHPADAALCYMPAAIAVILTPKLGVEFSFPAAIAAYWALSYRQGQSGRSGRASRLFEAVSVGALIVLVVMLIVKVF